MNYISRVGIGQDVIFHGKTDSIIEDVVFKVVFDLTGIDDYQITSKSRHREIVEARQMVHYLLKEYSNFSLSKIGCTTLNDHSTVIYSIKNIKNLIEYNKVLSAYILKSKIVIEEKIKNHEKKLYLQTIR